MACPYIIKEVRKSGQRQTWSERRNCGISHLVFLTPTHVLEAFTQIWLESRVLVSDMGLVAARFRYGSYRKRVGDDMFVSITQHRSTVQMEVPIGNLVSRVSVLGWF